jgi:uncharacterized radical SAM superfamily Fe-S cluster-containing enzyme
MERIHRKTRGVCHRCIQWIDAVVIEREGKVFLKKHCPQHGVMEAKLSGHPWYHLQLDRFYFDLIKEEYPQRDYIIRLTERCNLKCPICLAKANTLQTPDLKMSRLLNYLRTKRRLKVDLMSAEPTMRKDLPTIINTVSRLGHISALHTNGIKIADRECLKDIVSGGVGEVFLQFDGMDEEIYQKIRGQRLLEKKMKALNNLMVLKIPTSLICTIVKDINDNCIEQMLKLGCENEHVKEILFLGCRWLGSQADDAQSICLTPDEIIDMIEQQTKGMINRRDVFDFQRSYFTALSIFKVRKCLYVQHYIIVKQNGEYRPISDFLDLERMGRRLNLYRKALKRHHPAIHLPLLALALLGSFNRDAPFMFGDLLKIALLLKRGFALQGSPSKFILLGFITACDPLIFDWQVAKNCGKGEISSDLGFHNSGAVANILRERLFRTTDT